MTLMLGNLVLKEKALSTEQTENLFKNSKGEFIYFYLALNNNFLVK